MIKRSRERTNQVCTIALYDLFSYTKLQLGVSGRNTRRQAATRDSPEIRCEGARFRTCKQGWGVTDANCNKPIRAREYVCESSGLITSFEITQLAPYRISLAQQLNAKNSSRRTVRYEDERDRRPNALHHPRGSRIASADVVGVRGPARLGAFRTTSRKYNRRPRERRGYFATRRRRRHLFSTVCPLRVYVAKSSLSQPASLLPPFAVCRPQVSSRKR